MQWVGSLIILEYPPGPTLQWRRVALPRPLFDRASAQSFRDASIDRVSAQSFRDASDSGKPGTMQQGTVSGLFLNLRVLWFLAIDLGR